ncbi:MAG: hypothetical protein MUC53_08300 [Candidatus Contendobacter sp.]|jgi:hypothetical protein|nr:hypothetical protein [Candidatus Contendobacter sp.]
MNRPDYLGAKILAELSLRGPMTVAWLAQNLYESPRAIAASCVALARINAIRSWKTGNFYKSISGKKIAESFWELGPSSCPPCKPVRKRSTPKEPKIPVGIDDADLAWMEKYRRQAAQRRAQQKQGTSCPC